MKPRILIVDDEPGIRRAVIRALTIAGYEVESFGSAEHAIEEVSENGCTFDGAILDWLLPAMTGRELGGHLLTLCPNIELLFVSGYGALDLPSDVRLLRKPFELDALVAEVDAMLGRATDPGSGYDDNGS